MATINNAVQEMVDHLVDKMQSSNKLTAEEQTLVSNAIQKLSSSANLEAALVAVAEQHLDTATGEIKDASALVKDLQAKLLEQSDNLSLLPELETKFNEISASLVTNVAQSLANLPSKLEEPHRKLGEMHFVLDYYDNTAALIMDQKQNYGAYNVVSLVNHDAGTYHLYYDGGNQTNANNPAVVLEIDKNGAVIQSKRSTSLITSDNANFIGMFVSKNATTHLFSYRDDSKLISVYKQNELNAMSSHNVDYLKVYQSPQSKILYVVDSEILHTFDGAAWHKEINQSFNTESAFDQWALEQGLVALHSYGCAPNGTSNLALYGGIGYDYATGYSTNNIALQVKRPPVLCELSYENGLYERLPSIPTQNLGRHRVGFYNSRGDNLHYTKSFKSKVNLPNKGANIKATLESVGAFNGHNANHSQYDVQFHPQLLGFSPIHRAIVVFQYLRSYHSGGSILETALSRVYFA